MMKGQLTHSSMLNNKTACVFMLKTPIKVKAIINKEHYPYYVPYSRNLKTSDTSISLRQKKENPTYLPTVSTFMPLGRVWTNQHIFSFGLVINHVNHYPSTPELTYLTTSFYMMINNRKARYRKQGLGQL